MIPDLLLDNDNLVPEVRFAPGMVTSDIQIESVDVGEGRNRNKTPNNKKCQWPPHSSGKTAEQKIKELANRGFLKSLWNIWNGCTIFTTSVVVDADEDNYCKYKW